MPFALVVAGEAQNTRRQKTIRIRATPSGSYTVGGDPIDLTTITNPTFKPGVYPGQVPSINSVVENSPAGYSAELVAGSGTTLATAFNLKIYTAPGVEMTAIAYPAALTGDSFLIGLLGPNWGF